jgi:hypothetical protein
MRITLSIPDTIARLLETSLASHEDDLAAACRAANQDRELEREIDDWQARDTDFSAAMAANQSLRGN